MYTYVYCATKLMCIIDTCETSDGQIAQTSPTTYCTGKCAEGVPRRKVWVVPCTGFDYGS